MDILRNFGFLLKDSGRMYSINFERHAVEFGLTLSQCRVLSYLRRNEGITQVRLAVLTDTDPMTLVRMLDRMETAGLLERRQDPGDRRCSRLFLQAAAQPVLEEIERVSDCARAEAMAGLDPLEREQLLELLQRVHTNLDTLLTDVADAGPPKTKPRKCDAAPAPEFKS